MSESNKICNFAQEISVDTKKLLDVFEQYNCHTDGLPDKTEVNDMQFHIEKGYYEQLIHRFPENYIVVVLKYFESKEEYEICGSIMRRIAEHNKINNDSIKTNLDECKGHNF